MFGPGKKHSRIGQWNGRKRSSRSDELVLPRLLHASVLLRLAPVLVTALAVTYMAYLSGPPLLSRVGEIPSRDLRVRVYFELINEQQTEDQRDAAVEQLPAAQRDDPVARAAARNAVPPVFEKFPPATVLVPRGNPITERQHTLLEEEHRAFMRSLKRGDHVRRLTAMFLIMSLLAALVVLYVGRFQTSLAQSLPKIGAICVLAVVTLALAIVLSRPPWYAALIPLTFTAMVLTIVYNPQFALLMSFSLCLATTTALGGDLNYLLVQMGGLATAVLLLRNVRTRTRLVEVGAGAGLAFMAMTIATELLTGQRWGMIGFDAGRHFFWGTLAGFLLSGCLPLVERGFGIVTDVSLLELADGSHPLLQELIRRAPGTYTHSMTVATMAEAAAETISANPLLTRVGSYFHDIGKMLKPHYFIENQTGENRHDELEPALSTLIIIGHVKDGLALAKQYNLPRPVVDFIQQHHGTTLVEYFYHEAIRTQQYQGHNSAELESTFRYPGPKPQTRENGIVMLADAIESTSRALSEPTPSSLRKLVHDLLMKRLLDGQFEESGLTLTELHQVEDSLCKSLIALYHARIKYPDTKVRGTAS
ncbi:MAG TPA: HDIG domain-containing protein [Gemmataceae bacterium]|nr:HDIG domain-containing protein [Gemmataceae bacterium]